MSIFYKGKQIAGNEVTLSEVTAQLNQSLEDIEAKRVSSIESLETKKVGSLSEIDEDRENSLDQIDVSRQNSIEELDTLRNNSLSQVESTRDSVVADVTAEGTVQVNLCKDQVNLAKDEVALATAQAELATQKAEEAVGVAIGTYLDIASNSTYIPSGYLLRDGAEYNGSQFQDLWDNWLTTSLYAIRGYMEIYSSQISKGFNAELIFKTGTDITLEQALISYDGYNLAYISNGVIQGYSPNEGSVEFGDATANTEILVYLSCNSELITATINDISVTYEFKDGEKLIPNGNYTRGLSLLSSSLINGSALYSHGKYNSVMSYVGSNTTLEEIGVTHVGSLIKAESYVDYQQHIDMHGYCDKFAVCYSHLNCSNEQLTIEFDRNYKQQANLIYSVPGCSLPYQQVTFTEMDAHVEMCIITGEDIDTYQEIFSSFDGYNAYCRIENGVLTWVANNEIHISETISSNTKYYIGYNTKQDTVYLYDQNHSLIDTKSVGAAVTLAGFNISNSSNPFLGLVDISSSYYGEASRSSEITNIVYFKDISTLEYTYVEKWLDANSNVINLSDYGISIINGTVSPNDTITITPVNTFIAPLANPNNRVLIEKKEPTDADPTWYNLYNDGWCEQGGAYTGNATLNVTLLKPYINTAYNIIISGSAKITAHTTLGFTVDSNFGYSTKTDGYWETKGYTDQAVEDSTRPYVVVANGELNPSDMDWSQWATSLEGKVDKGDMIPCATIIEWYESGTEGYILYSNNYCEQWGKAGRTAVSQAITLFKPYRDVNYGIMLQPYHTALSTDGRPPLVYNAETTTDGFTINLYTGYAGAYWRTYGFVQG